MYLSYHADACMPYAYLDCDISLVFYVYCAYL